MRSFAIVFCAMLIFLSSTKTQARVIHVPGDSATIQAAINGTVDGDTVLVSDNTYTGPQNRNLDFKGKNILLKSENGPQVTIIDCEESGRGFRFHNGEDTTAVVDGFTITRGSGGDGSGLYCHWSFPTIRNCVFIGNLQPGGEGGAVRIDGCFAKFVHCAFINNYSYSRGGAVSCTQNYQPSSFINCTFSGNKAGRGGAISCDDAWPIMENCLIAFGTGGGAVYGSHPDDTPVLKCCDIYCNAGGDWVGNIADQGGMSGNFSADPLFCDTSTADFHLLYDSPCQPQNNKCGLVGAYGVGCINVQFPIAQRINYGGTTLDTIVTSATPEIFWSYYDTAATTQMEYEIEVGTDWDWATAEMWSSGPVVSSNTSVVYDGAPLSDHITYYLRIRLNNGSTWGTWRYAKLVTRLSTVVHVPADEPTIQAGIDRALETVISNSAGKQSF
jgi:predicted outer membrane repeat protein